MKRIITGLAIALSFCGMVRAVEIRGSIEVVFITNYPTPPIPVAITGQTNSYQTGDDGYYEAGVNLPVGTNRWTIQADTNLIVDNRTGLMWTRDAHRYSGAEWYTNWSSAISNCEALDYGGYTDWRLPNRSELMSLLSMEPTVYNPSLPLGHPFNNTALNPYWTSTTYVGGTSAYYVHIRYGESAYGAKNTVWRVWPVRGP